MDYFAACEYFHKCFRDPSVFTAVIVGSFKAEALVPLVLQYLVGEVACGSRAVRLRDYGVLGRYKEPAR